MSLARVRSYITQSSCHFKTTQLAAGTHLCTRHTSRAAFNDSTTAYTLPVRRFCALGSRQTVIGNKSRRNVSHIRNYATETQESAPGTARSQTVVVISPNPSNVEDLELISPEKAYLELTERAAERLRSISTTENDPDIALRIAVESGGCHGYQYMMELTSEHALDDYKFVHPKYRNAALVVDAISLSLLKGATVDYATELIGTSFRIVDNPQAKGNGCGCGVSWEANV